MTAAGFAPFERTADELAAGRTRVRQRLGIPAGDLVLGLAGSLVWARRVGYCYGRELVAARLEATRPGVHALVVGDGGGLDRLKEMAGGRLGRDVHLPGRVPRDEVPDYLAAADVLSLPQSLDKVGSFRYSTKLSEYLAAGVPIVTGRLPLAYDFGEDWLWRLPGDSPWDPRYVRALAGLMDRLTPAEAARKAALVPRRHPEFDRDRQVSRVTEFLNDLLTDRAHARSLSTATPRSDH
jgi:hypothetical protein